MFKDIKVIEVSDWDKLVKTTYGRMYSYQQQDGCKMKGFDHLSTSNIPCEAHMNNSIPYEVNGDIMGVKFQVWLDADPKFDPFEAKYENEIFWERNFYPEVGMIIQDLIKKELLEDVGDFSIDINW